MTMPFEMRLGIAGVICLMGAAGCSHPATAALIGGSDKADDVGTMLGSGDIADVGSLSPMASLEYTAKSLYMGGRLDLQAGQMLAVTNEIDAVAKPVIVIADGSLNELVKQVGSAIVEGPNANTSIANVQFPVPSSGSYWLLFGEAKRKNATLNTVFKVMLGAHSVCAQDDDCYTAGCDADLMTCAQSPPRATCLKAEDCSSGKCGTDHACEFLMQGDVCQHPSDCPTSVCPGGFCGCVPKGEKPSDPLKPQECCSSGTTLGVCT
jgi:hypothetical protein